MASSSVESRNLICLYWWDTETGKRFCINFISDPRQDNSIKLPQCIIERADLPMSLDKVQQDGDIIKANDKKIEASIASSLEALYGNKLPRIYLTEDSKNFVMNLYIYEPHAEKLVRMALQPMNLLFMMFSKLTLLAVQQHISKVIQEPDVLINFSKFILLDHGEILCGVGSSEQTNTLEQWPNIRVNPNDVVGRCEPMGRRAKKDEIVAFLLDAPYKEILPEEPSGSRLVGDKRHLLCLGRRDQSLGRSIYYNIVASDKANSIRLPDLMIEMSKLPRKKAYLRAELTPGPQIERDIADKLAKYLNGLYHQKEPLVRVCEKSDKDLVIDVPVYAEQMPIFRRYLMGKVRMAFFVGITTQLGEYFLRESRRMDLKANENLWPTDSGTDFMKSGRPATNEEIYSLLLAKKGTPKQMTQSIGQWGARLLR